MRLASSIIATLLTPQQGASHATATLITRFATQPNTLHGETTIMRGGNVDDDIYALHYSHYPRSYTAHRVDAPVLIDGDLTKTCWESIPWSETFGDIQGSDAPSQPPSTSETRMKLLWDDEYLYIAAKLTSYQKSVITTYTERNSPIYQQDSDFEVFLDPSGSCHNYKELELNAWNTVWNLMLDKPYDNGGIEHSARVEQDPNSEKYYEVDNQKSSVQLLEGELNADGGAVWTVEIKMSHSDTLAKYSESDQMRYQPKVGGFWRINFSRVEDKGGINWTWVPQTIWDPEVKQYKGKIAMHLPDAWGYVRFGDAVSERSMVKSSEYDTSWPARLAAMNVYYAESQYRSIEGSYASDMSQLESFLDLDILAPFDVHIEVDDSDNLSYLATVKSKRTSERAIIKASVTNDRLVSSSVDYDAVTKE